MGRVLLQDVLSLPAAERLELVERIWESLSSNPAAVPVTEAQKQELDRRMQSHRENPEAGSAWEDIKARIRPKS
jgi:putative addiction module component (TIGR02574 family)